MKELIIKALDEAYLTLSIRTPQTKKETVYAYIEDVEPLELADFMKSNNIPDNAYFGAEPNSYDSFDRVCLCWEIDAPTTDKDRLTYKRDKFTYIASKPVFEALSKAGFKRKSFSSLGLRFKDTTVYDMYINKDFDRLVEYYSLYFSFNGENNN